MGKAKKGKDSDGLGLGDLVFVGLRSKVFAMHRYSGDIIWTWKAPKGGGYGTSILIDGDRLVVGVNGYVYCLEPLRGGEIWSNPLKGHGNGITCLASVHGSTGSSSDQAQAQQTAAAIAAAAAAGAAS